MSFDVASYNSETFYKLPSLHDAEMAFNRANGPAVLKNIGEIFRKYNQQFNFSLILLHRHFHQQPYELTVEVLSESTSISMPWQLSEEPWPCDIFLEYLKTTNLDKSIGKFVRPHSWSFNADGTLSPYEFVSTNRQEVTIPGDFVAALHEKLKSLKLESVLGLHWNHRDIEKIGLEDSHSTLRANILELKEEFTDSEIRNSVCVVWGFWSISGEAISCNHCYLNVDDQRHYTYRNGFGARSTMCL